MNRCGQDPHFSGVAGDEQSVDYSGPEVGFEEIAIDLLQARFWITSDLPTIRGLTMVMKRCAAADWQILRFCETTADSAA
jgi:hypothetical protein